MRTGFAMCLLKSASSFDEETMPIQRPLAAAPRPGQLLSWACDGRRGATPACRWSCRSFLHCFISVRSPPRAAAGPGGGGAGGGGREPPRGGAAAFLGLRGGGGGSHGGAGGTAAGLGRFLPRLGPIRPARLQGHLEMEQQGGQQPALLPDQLPDGGRCRCLHRGVSAWAGLQLGRGLGWRAPGDGALGVAPVPVGTALRLHPVPRERVRSGPALGAALPGGMSGVQGQGSCLSLPLPLLEPPIYLRL